MAIISPFDLERIFMIVAGTPEILTGLLIIGLSGLGGYFHMDGKVMMIMYLVAGIIMSTYIGAIYILIILIIGIIVFTSLARFFDK